MGTAIDEDEANPQPSTSSQVEERKPLSNTLKYLTAAAIFYGNITFGSAFNTYGPTATTMQNKYETDDASISRVFTILTVGYMLGALSAGFIFNFIKRQLMMIILISAMAAIMFITPHCPTMTTYFITAGVMGWCCGCYDVAQFVWIMEMMQKDCPPYVQSQHFFYALGTSLAAVIMAPFLDDDDDDDGTITTTTLASFSFNGNISIESTTKKAEIDDSKLFIPYTIIGALTALTSVVQILLYIFFRYHPPPPEILEPEQIEALNSRDKGEELLGNESAGGFKIGSWSLAKLRMVVLSCIFYGAYQGMEMCTFQFFPKFGQNSDLHLSESESTYVLTGMTTAFAVGRAISIIIVFKISTQIILCGNIVLVFAANVLLIGWASNSLPILWTSSILFGLGFSSVYPSFSAFIERYLEFTDFIVSLVIVCGSGVASIYPLIIGNSIEENPVVLSYTSFFSIGFVIIAFGTLSFLTFKNKTRY